MKLRASYPMGVALLFCTMYLSAATAFCRDLPDIKQAGVLRHIGIPYANFVTGSGDGMDVEIMQLFAKHLGVKYEYVKADWGTVVPYLIGRKIVKVDGENVELGEEVPVMGDLIANGFTIIPWRKKVVIYSTPTFPSQIWLIARSDSKLRPIKPSGTIDKDIAAIRKLMNGKKILAVPKTCLDPKLYNLAETGADISLFEGNLNELAPALINNDAEFTILDVPDALIALEKWGGKIKIIGPVSRKQELAVGFPKESVKLQQAYNDFLKKLKKDGTYDRLVKKYYPTATAFFPDFFKN